MKSLKFNNPDMKLYVKSMGKLFRVTAVCKSDDEANAIMEKDRDQALIAEDCNGLLYLARQYGAVCPSHPDFRLEIRLRLVNRRQS